MGATEQGIDVGVKGALIVPINESQMRLALSLHFAEVVGGEEGWVTAEETRRSVERRIQHSIHS